MPAKTHDKGNTAEGTVMAAVLRSGKSVLVPFGGSQRYDLVIEDGNRFLTVQCKTGRLRDGYVVFNACSSHYHRGHESRDYRGEVDLFGVYCPDNGAVYMVPVMDASTRKCRLRVEPAKNRQSKGVRLASKYEIARIAQ